MQKVIVTGSNGQLGSEIRQLSAGYPSFEFIFFDRQTLDISDKEAVEKMFAERQPQYCLNCAAYTAVDKAEIHKEAAFKINAEGAANLADAAKKCNTKLIHVSTDYVFNGKSKKPYHEEDETAPINVYGHSKLAGEKGVVAVNPNAIIIRTSWVFSSFGNNFVKTMLRLLSEKKDLNVVADQQGTPTYARHLAAAMLHIIVSKKWVPGMYHFTNDGETTWFHFAQAIKEQSGAAGALHAITTAQYPTPAERPHYSILSKEKIKSVYHLQLAPWQEALCACLKELKKQPEN